MEASKDFLTKLRDGESKPARLALKALSLCTGIFLIFAGLAGMTVIFTSGISEGTYFVGSMYAVIFGMIVLVVEVNDKAPMVSVAYHWIDVYLKFLTLQARD